MIPKRAEGEPAVKVKIAQYTLRFVTPAFLGDADQDGRWRTPPIKALLRQWWRVAYAQHHNFRVDVARMRRLEGCLFGNAWLESPSPSSPSSRSPAPAKSLLRLRLNRWDEGGDVKAEATVSGGNRDGWRTNRRDNDIYYLGYGPLTREKAVAIGVGNKDTATLSLAWPEEIPPSYKGPLEAGGGGELERHLRTALWLVDRYGAMGNRCRNGWGSVELRPADSHVFQEGEPPLRTWTECLELDWPHAIGRDENGALIWCTEPYQDWQSLMKGLGIVRKQLRAKFEFRGEHGASRGGRHWLAYPVTRHPVRSWDDLHLRLPNQLRFKARRKSDEKLLGVIFHMPHLPPKDFDLRKEEKKEIQRIWRRVHEFLDASDFSPSSAVRLHRVESEP